MPLHSAANPVRPSSRESEPPLVYRLSIPAPASHRYHIRITEERPTNAKLEFAIPAWTPGYYQILDYQADIEHVQATDGSGRPLPVSHPSARVWSVDRETQAVPSTLERIVVEYDVYARDTGLGFFGSALDSELQRGYINGASAFLYEVGKTQRPVRLETALPPNWKLVTSLTSVNPPVEATSSGVDVPILPLREAQPAVPAFTASSYDAMIDCPIQIGQSITTTEFEADGAVFQCVCTGSRDWDKKKVSAILGRIVHAAAGIFGKPPFKHYVFFYHIGGGGFTGGLEHSNSTVIHLEQPLKDGGAEEFQTVSAHEFFHAWNVKRVRPAGLGPFDYTQPVRTSSLWWAEGVTDYYADLLLYRAGLRDKTWLLNDLADRMSELDNNPARLRVSLEEASRKAWEGESEGFDGLSYYLKGSLIGLYFDLRLRASTGGNRSLDDVMRLMDTEYGNKNRAYPDGALLDNIEAVAAVDLHAEYAEFVRSHGEIEWNSVLGAVGLALHRESASYLGLQMHEGKGGAKDGPVIDVIETGSAAARSGLQPNDVLVALDGQPITVATFKEQLGRLAPHTPIVFTVLRRGAQITLAGDSGVRFSRYRLTARPETAAGAAGSGLFLPTRGTGSAVSAP